MKDSDPIYIYMPIFSKKNTCMYRYNIFQNIRTKLFHIQSCDNITINEKANRDLFNNFVELFIECSPDERIIGFKTIDEAIDQFDKDFE